MLANVCAEIVDALCDAGVNARAKYSGGDVGQITEPVIFVGVSEAKAAAAGLGHYLGTKHREDGTSCEVYGLVCQIMLALDIYTGAKMQDCGGACADIFDEALCAVSKIEGITVSEACVGEGSVQHKGGLYKCPCSIKGQVYLVSESEDGTEFTDFILKGVLKNEC